MKIAVVTDSTAYLSQEECEALGVTVLPLSVTFEGKSYVEGVDLTADTFYDLVRGAKELPKSSQPALGFVVETFERLAATHDAIISIHLSSAISGTYQTSASMAREFEQIEVYAVDSRRACGAQAQLVREAVRLAGEGVAASEIVQRLNEMVTKQQVYFLVDNLFHLQKGGRLSAGAAMIGSLLKVKPLLTIDGEISVFEKIRTTQKAFSRMNELVANEAAQSYPLTITLHHANAEQQAQAWRDQLLAAFPDLTIYVVPFGPVIGTHLGEGAVGVTLSPTTSASH